MQRYLNQSNMPLSIAVFLATDNYDHDDNAISATGLIKPIRQIILEKRLPPDNSLTDISSMVSSRIGSAIHDAIERSWKTNYLDALEALGYPPGLIQRIRINPQPEEVNDTIVPVYMEQRAYREIDGYRISGKYDFIAEGRLEDFKSTSAITYISRSNEPKWALQGSLYRWLNPELVTEDDMVIRYIFTDWSAIRARTEENYPANRITSRYLKLLSLEETELYVRNKLRQLEQYKDAPEEELPECTDDDLWRSSPVFKYYKNPEKRSRSTKNFDNAADAYMRLAKDGNVGIVVENPGQVTACKYCAAFPICSQKDRLIQDGSLQI